MRRSPSLGSLVALCLVALPGCSNDTESETEISPIALAAQQCAQVVECSCGYFTNSDIGACIDSSSGSVDSVQLAAEAAGLEYDADCAARQVAWYDELGCAIQADELLVSASCALNCALYHGYVGPGEECTVVAPRASDCAAGLECVDGFCLDVCNNWRLAEGATCYNPDNPPTGTCVSGTHCDFGETNRCIRTPGRGESCPDNICLSGNWCNDSVVAEGICQAVGGVGAACTGSQACETGYCIDDVCAPYPNAGEQCSGECADDLYCQSGTCTIKQGLWQSCGFDLPCAAGLSCIGDVCQQGRPLVCEGYF